MKGYIAICTDTSLRCLRDLRGSHVAMLERLRDECLAVLPEDVVQCSIHYHPSVYQLHVHFRSNEGRSGWPRVHLLDDVIANLRTDSDYYRKATIMFSMPSTSDIHKVFVEGRLIHASSVRSESKAECLLQKCGRHTKHTSKTCTSSALWRGACK
eukprot:1582942-Rhodomonas_salina.3